MFFMRAHTHTKTTKQKLIKETTPDSLVVNKQLAIACLLDNHINNEIYPAFNLTSS